MSDARKPGGSGAEDPTKAEDSSHTPEGAPTDKAHEDAGDGDPPLVVRPRLGRRLLSAVRNGELLVDDLELGRRLVESLLDGVVAPVDRHLLRGWGRAPSHGTWPKGEGSPFP